ncbi:MAG: hypothetical protein KZQ85_08845 [Candidatus Thiodiazotropha sp. (ex Myrtea sp. 'scaly one' KF741663)]|nr:hypothetical protein [Candidatus Thiodiazotropha sp. (ex Myrtea sp. 'scaly one' KF741663)]
MNGETIAMLLISGGLIWAALKVLEAIFVWAIKAFNAIGSFVVAAIPAVISVFLSSLFFDISVAQAAVQYTATNAVLGGIGLQMFGGSQDNV